MHDASFSNVPALWFGIDLEPAPGTTECSAMFSLPAAVLGSNGSSFKFEPSTGDGSSLVLKQTAPGVRAGELRISAFAVTDGDTSVPVELSWQTGEGLTEVFDSFKASGELSSAAGGNSTQGALAAKLSSIGKGPVTIVFTMCWYLPHRMWAAGEEIGQQYSRFQSAATVETWARNPTNYAAALQSAADMQALYFNNSFPPWLRVRISQTTL